jgi:hypothetical protein
MPANHFLVATATRRCVSEEANTLKRTLDLFVAQDARGGRFNICWGVVVGGTSSEGKASTCRAGYVRMASHVTLFVNFQIERLSFAAERLSSHEYSTGCSFLQFLGMSSASCHMCSRL